MKKVLSILLVLLLVVSVLPIGTLAADAQPVRVIVENTTLRTDAAPWHDLLFDAEVAWSEGLTMEGALKAAAKAEGVELVYQDSVYGSYLVGIAGLGASQGGGWMASTNDWFDPNNGMAAVTVQPGDTVRVVYTMDWGTDVGAVYGGTDKRLKDLSFNYGVLYPAFDPDVTEYTLYIPSDVENVLVTPTAANKYLKVFVVAGDEDASYFGAREVAVADKTVTVKVDGGAGYTVNLVPMEQTAPTDVTEPTDVTDATEVTDVTGATDVTEPTKPCDGGDNCPSKAFKDVDRSADSWYHMPVDWAVTHDPFITDGIADDAFGPKASCLRAQVVTFLWRAAGCPEPKSTENPFTDVKDGDYFCKAVLWAFENKITDGMTDTTFGAKDTCTREQFVTFLWRYEKTPEPGIKDNPFKDVTENYAYSAILWAFERGVTDGTSETEFSPKATCTRAHVVTFLYRDLAAAEAKALSLAAASPLDAAKDYVLKNFSAPTPGSEWIVMDLARNAAANGEALPADYAAYYGAVAAKAKETAGKMDANYTTDYARYTLAVTALGYNAADVAGYDLTAPLQDAKTVTAQGVNGAIFALLALDSGDYPSYARPDYVAVILAEQLADGGFNYGFGSDADPDLTAMALQALAPYLGDEAVAAAADKAANCLSNLQAADGGFPNAWSKYPSSETTAQAVIAEQTLLTQPGNTAVDVTGLFTKGDATLMSNLLSFQLADGSFCHEKVDPTANAYATEQCLRALVSAECAALGVTLYGVR